MAALERRLALEVQALADWKSGEAAWRRADLQRLGDSARAAGLATRGGQVQLRLAGAAHELYWQDYDPSERRACETWLDYVDRTWREMLFLVAGLAPDQAIIDGARRIKPALAQIGDAEALNGLWFVVYLEAGADADR